ncbi:Chemotaxis protein methyltransferase [Legionella massiliensis]|uniref:Chemotaxis protein methyltransferase n=1 Tax=Legionella massiliensis TaxID=1034943 RepID=A0A078KYP5_9GAMM|nr:CheR family methyltransferase [Legionella massiliensis]CDZ76853.1 Chemotaxis protein methyltransferase [Legionella massiliensis]CEE12591.1 putative biofilm formation methyltransferase WspC [Legionella massiliensis]
MNLKQNIEIELLLEAMKKCYGFDLSLYATTFLERRILHRLKLSGLKYISDLQTKLIHDVSFFEQLLNDFSVTVTSFFRDPEVFLAIRKTIVPVLKTYPFIRVWVAGCATGEEVYSLAILLYEEGFLSKTHFYATDFNKESLGHASAGVFDLGQLELHEKSYKEAGGKSGFSDYYDIKNQTLVMKSFLKKNMIFSYHNLVCDGVFGEIHLLLCRNVLIYFNRPLQERVINLFTDSLIYRGFLCLGTKESIQFLATKHQYEEVEKDLKIYRKRGIPNSNTIGE